MTEFLRIGIELTRTASRRARGARTAPRPPSQSPGEFPPPALPNSILAVSPVFELGSRIPPALPRPPPPAGSHDEASQGPRRAMGDGPWATFL